MTIHLHKIGDYLINIYACKNIWGDDGFGARGYHPYQGAWLEILESWDSTQDGALEKAQTSVREWMREAHVAEMFKPVFEQLERDGYSPAEILNGLSELAYRRKYPNDAIWYLEKAVEKAEEQGESQV